MRVAGVDVSTFAIDIVTLEMSGDDYTWWHYPLRGDNLIDRIRYAGRAYEDEGLPGRNALFWDELTGVGVERPMKRGHGSAQPMMALGAVLTRIPDWMLVYDWKPSEWRARCGLKGNAPKADVAAWVSQRRLDLADTKPWAQDACDAYCIAYATRAAIETVPSTPVDEEQKNLLPDDNRTPD